MTLFSKICSAMERTSRKQMILYDNDKAVLHAAVPVVLAAAVLVPKLCLLAAVLALALGYRFSVDSALCADEVVTEVPHTAKPVNAAE